MFKEIGATFILVGCEIGAGMLVLPVVPGLSSFWIAECILIAIWLLMTLSGLLLLEVNLGFTQNHNSFDSMSQAIFGWPGKIVSMVSCFFLMYALLASYISGTSSLIVSFFHDQGVTWFNNFWGSLFFILIFGGIIVLGTKWVDFCNRGFVVLKITSLIASFCFLFPHLDASQLMKFPGAISNYKIPSLVALPVFLCSFGYQTVLPSIVNYIGFNPKKLRLIIWAATTTAFIIYSLWLVNTIGILNPDILTEISNSTNQVYILILNLAKVCHHPFLNISINVFADIAMITSFFGVGLGLFDYVADLRRGRNNFKGRLNTGFIVFLIPMFFSIFDPNGFLFILEKAAIFGAVIALILPSAMALKMRHDQKMKTRYHAKIPNFIAILLLAFGLITMFSDIILS